MEPLFLLHLSLTKQVKILSLTSLSFHLKFCLFSNNFAFELQKIGIVASFYIKKQLYLSNKTSHPLFVGRVYSDLATHLPFITGAV